MMYDLLDLAPYLKAGENTIAVYVKYYGAPNSFWIPAVPNSGLGKTGVMVFEANLGETGWLVSDASWKATKCHAWEMAPLMTATRSAAACRWRCWTRRKLPVGWQSAGFDDNAWRTAQVLRAMHIGGFARSQPPTDPYGPLYPRPIAQLGGAVVAPVSVQAEHLSGAVDTAEAASGARVVASMSLPASRLPRGGSTAADRGVESGCRTPRGRHRPDRRRPGAVRGERAGRDHL